MQAPIQSTILIVDQCPLTSECIGMILRSQKHKVLACKSIEEATALAKKHHPKIILSELQHPDGIVTDLHRQLNDIDGFDGTVVLFTHECDKTVLLHTLEHGLVHVMVKSAFSIKQFLQLINRVLLAHSKNTQSTENLKGQMPAPKTKPAGIPIPAESNSTNIVHPVNDLSTSNAILHSLKPVFSRSEVDERIEQIAELKALSPTVARVLSLTRSADSSLDSIAKAIRNDHAIALKIIKLANSSAFSPSGTHITTLNEAVLRMGCNQIRQTVINIEIMNNFSDKDASYIDHRLFWEHSVGVALCCSLLARESKLMHPDDAFTLGLLHDVGRMILYSAFEDEYIEVIRASQESHFPTEIVERRLLLVDHASIMQTVLRKWGLKRELVDPIANHHLSVGNIRQTCPKQIPESCSVALANRIVHALGIGCSGNQTIYPTEEYFEALNLPKSVLTNIVDRLPDMVQDLRLSMLGDMGLTNFPECPKPKLSKQFNPLYITMQPTIDAMSYWINDIADDPQDAPRNFIVANMRNKNDAVRIDSMIDEAEQEHGVKDLPVLVLSPSGKLNLPQITQQKREILTLKTPFTLQQFARALLTYQSLPNKAGRHSDQHESLHNPEKAA
jgi:putative nucleotidyltransferase with HDIG domain